MWLKAAVWPAKVLADYSKTVPEITNREVKSIRLKKGREYNEYYLHYKFMVEGKEISGHREVSEELFQKAEKAKTLSGYVYWNQDPNEHGSLVAYKSRMGLLATTKGQLTFAAIILVYGLLLWALYRFGLKKFIKD